MNDLVCRVVTNPSDMAALASAWQALADRALEANPFYEPSFLRPLIEETGPYPGLLFWLVAPQHAPGDLRGVFPFHRRRVGPMTLLSPFTRGRSGGQHIDIDLGVPLVDAGCADAVIDAVLDRVDRNWLIGLDWFALTEDGLLHRVLVDRLAARVQPNLDLGGWARPLFKPRETADTYVMAALSRRRRNHVRAYRRHLVKDGEMRFEVLVPNDEIAPWIETYFALEASGWKGQQGSDVGATVEARRFFTRAMQARHATGGLFAYRLAVAGKVIAQMWILQCANRALGYAWKMSYDAVYAKESPGLLLELEAMGLMHSASRPIQAIDSCAQSQHRLLSWLWLDKRRLACLLVVSNTGLHRACLCLAAKIRKWRTAVRSPPPDIAATSESDA